MTVVLGCVSSTCNSFPTSSRTLQSVDLLTKSSEPETEGDVSSVSLIGDSLCFRVLYALKIVPHRPRPR